MRRERLSIGNDGWVSWEADSFPADVLVRFKESGGGRLEAIEIYAAGDHRIDARTLARLPLGRIVKWANGPDVRVHIVARLGLPGPDLRRLASYYATTFGSRAPRNWVMRSFRAQYDGSDEPQAPLQGRHRGLTRSAGGRTSKLRVPDTPPYPDSFYRKVADLHSGSRITAGIAAAEIATMTGKPITTVYRWIKEARRRGFLPPTRVPRG